MKSLANPWILSVFILLGAGLCANGSTPEYQSLDVPRPIPDNSTMISTLYIPDPGVIVDLDVQLTISHYWDTDLDVFLIGPDGTQVELFTDVGGMGWHFVETRLDDEAPYSIANGFAPFTGSYRPEGTLSDFDGKNLTGKWQLRVRDDTDLISGTLEDWCLIIERAVPVEPPEPPDKVVEYCSSDTPKPIPDMSTIISTLDIVDTGIITGLDVQLTISHMWDADLDVSLVGPDGTQVELFTDAGGWGDNFVETRLDCEAPNSINDASAPFTGSFRPEGDLCDFYGKPLAGQWQLRVTDDAYLFSGTLESWCLQVKNDPIFLEVFQSTEFDPNQWTTAEGVIIDEGGLNEPSPPYSLHLDGSPAGGDSIESRFIDLSDCASAALTYWYQRTGSGNSPETGEDLVVSYWDGFNWVEVRRHAGDGPDMIDYEQVMTTLPPQALHEFFCIKIHNTGNNGAWDDWFVDDVEIHIHSADPNEFRLLGGTGMLGTNTFSLVELGTDPPTETPIGKANYNPGLDTDPNGTLYGASDNLRIINPSDGSYIRVGSIDSLQKTGMLMRSISFAPDGRLYGIDLGSGDLYEIDPETAWATWICEMPVYVWGIDFAPDGTLYGAGWQLFILEIDSPTCQVVEVGDLHVSLLLNDIDVAPDGFVYAVNYDSGTVHKIDPKSDAGESLIVEDYGPYESEIWGIASEVLPTTKSQRVKSPPTTSSFMLMSVDTYSAEPSGESNAALDEMIQVEKALKTEYQRAQGIFDR